MRVQERCSATSPSPDSSCTVRFHPRSRSSLGARCIWLMPVAASPSYHGYDVKNYYRVNPEYGSTADFKRLVADAHRRGMARFTAARRNAMLERRKSMIFL